MCREILCCSDMLGFADQSYVAGGWDASFQIGLVD